MDTPSGLEAFSPAMDERRAALLPALSLAYVGDTVFDLLVRTRLVQQDMGDAGAMHRAAISLVNAAAQARHARMLLEAGRLTEREREIFMRGRNAKPGTVPRHMSVGDYHYATGLEAVVGYLYLCGQTARIEELLEDLEAASPSHEN